MRCTPLRRAIFSLALCLVALAGCGSGQADPPNHPVAPADVPVSADWTQQRQARNRAYLGYLKDKSVGYDWFANFANGNDGVPFILLRSLPDLDPDTFGPAEEKFAKFGYFFDPNEPDRPLPRGLGWAPLNEGDNSPSAYPIERYDPSKYDRKNPAMHVVSLTCGACHIGRVRGSDGKDIDIVGGPNTQVDVRKWRHAFEVLIAKFGLLGPDEVVGPTADALMKIIASKPPGYFYQGYRGMDADAEATQRAFYTDRGKVIALLQGFAGKVYVGEMAALKQTQTSYVKLNAPPLNGGSPGQSDGSGDLIPKLLILDEIVGAMKTGGDKTKAITKFTVTNYPAMPHSLATVTDILSTWKQESHPFGQIDGSVKSLFYRNIAAILAIAGNPARVDYYNAQISGDFIDKLPAPPYPFDVDMDKAKKGEALFKTNCAICHQPEGMWKGKPFNKTNFDLGTDPNRAKVLSPAGEALFVASFKAGIPTDYTIPGPDGKPIYPAALPASEIVFDRTKPEDQGYVTNDLMGVWARAPYLHNGSVPTLRHLLAPHRKGSERPTLFVRGSISYDPVNVGFVWETGRIAEFRAVDPTVALFDTTQDGESNAGHDRDVEIEGVLRRLDWSKDEQAGDLGCLLEYLKTL
jgi:hypothetical protein